MCKNAMFFLLESFLRTLVIIIQRCLFLFFPSRNAFRLKYEGSFGSGGTYFPLKNEMVKAFSPNPSKFCVCLKL